MKKCPSCGTNDAYIGANKIECLDHRCKYYSEQWVKDYLRTESNINKAKECEMFNKMTDEEFEEEIEKSLKELDDFII